MGKRQVSVGGEQARAGPTLLVVSDFDHHSISSQVVVDFLFPDT